MNDKLIPEEIFSLQKSVSKDFVKSDYSSFIPNNDFERLEEFRKYLTEKKIIKTVFLISTIAVAISVLLQHVHYTIDVFAAVFFTCACYRLLLAIKKIEL